MSRCLTLAHVIRRLKFETMHAHDLIDLYDNKSNWKGPCHLKLLDLLGQKAMEVSNLFRKALGLPLIKSQAGGSPTWSHSGLDDTGKPEVRTLLVYYCSTTLYNLYFSHFLQTNNNMYYFITAIRPITVFLNVCDTYILISWDSVVAAECSFKFKLSNSLGLCVDCSNWALRVLSANSWEKLI